jgi:hypothetical protein
MRKSVGRYPFAGIGYSQLGYLPMSNEEASSGFHMERDAYVSTTRRVAKSILQ